MPKLVQQVIVANEQGLHARPAMKFVDVASRFASEIRVSRVGVGEDTQSVDGKSIMQMLTMLGVQGTTYQLEADGEDAPLAIAELLRLFQQRFGEQE